MIRPPIDELEALLVQATRLPRPLCRMDVAIASDLHGDSERLVVAAVNALPSLLAYVRALESLAEARGRAVDAADAMAADLTDMNAAIRYRDARAAIPKE